MNIKQTRKIGVMTAAVALAISGAALAGNEATQTVGYEVTAIDEIAVSGNPGALTINSATAGSQPDAVTDSGTTYAITTNGTNKKITAALDTAMPENVTLSLTATAPSGGTSSGKVALGATAADVVTGITKVATSGIGLSYELAATVSAGVVASANKTVTFTLTDGS
ncbi:MAG: hypothetical protein K9L70_06440 [Thiohalocapsa sp.]|nr:hypothetical protein [Thiohalocapsa sp.]MCF7989878.1 hypothetical protein [Thiohalocapsa sp.]